MESETAMSHVCDIGRPVLECDGRLTPVRWCPTLLEGCGVCGGLVCPEHGCQSCGRRRDKTPDDQARAVNDARVLGSGAGYIGRHRA